MKNITEKERISILGTIGEKIFTNYASEQGFKVEQSINPFDNKYLRLNSKLIVTDLLDTLFSRQFNSFKNFNLGFDYNSFDLKRSNTFLLSYQNKNTL